MNYATGWPVTRATKDTTVKRVAEFFHDNIFTYYKPPKELLFNNSTNLLAQVVKHYIRKLSTKHRNTTPYHPRTNGKVKNLNKTLGAMLTKYFTNKPTML